MHTSGSCWLHSPSVLASRTRCWIPVGQPGTTGWWSVFTATGTASHLPTAGRCQSTNTDAKYPFVWRDVVLLMLFWLKCGIALLFSMSASRRRFNYTVVSVLVDSLIHTWVTGGEICRDMLGVNCEHFLSKSHWHNKHNCYDFYSISKLQRWVNYKKVFKFKLSSFTLVWLMSLDLDIVQLTEV